MAVLVTGGAGFIGSNLIDKLLKENLEIICIDNFDDNYNPEIKRENIEHNLGNKNFSLVEVDLRNKDELKTAMSKYEIDKVVHLAAKTSVRWSIKNPRLCLNNNILGTTNLLELSRKLNIKNFIFGSSSSVYGNNETPFKENDNIENIISPYAESKKHCETICQKYSSLYSIPMICLRFFTVYGPRQRPDMAIYKFTRLINLKKEIEVYGGGLSERDYTYVDDVVNGIICALNKRFQFEIFNIGTGRTTELMHLVSLIEKHLSKKAKIKHTPHQSGDVQVTCADISKGRKMLGYDPQMKISDGINLFVEWYNEREME